MDGRDYCVYIHTNKTNGKIYVGVTKNRLQIRTGRGSGYKRSPRFYNAIQKYGWDNFTHEIFADKLTEEEASEWERFLIAFFQSDNREFGYNIQPGGISAGGMSEEGKRSLKEHNIGLNANKRRPVCVFDSCGYKIAEFPLITFAANHYGIKRGTIINHLRRGKHLCNGMIFMYADDVGELTILPPSILSKYTDKKDTSGSNSHRAKGVVIFDVVSGERVAEYQTISDAARSFRGDIQACLLRRQATFGNRYTARYADDVGKIELLPQDERINPSNVLPNYRKSICQYSLDGELIRRYASAAEASRVSGIGYKAICLCASGKTKTSGGYKWNYEK